MGRKNPNIAITGTPGVGKTTHAELLARNTGFKHVSVNQIVKEEGFHEGKDEKLGSWIVDEDKLLDHLEVLQKPGGIILDWHGVDLYPERWIDLVVVIRCDNSVLHDRLSARGYSSEKIEENISAEILEVLVEEARGAYREGIVVELRGENVEELEGNVSRIEGWVEEWRRDNGGEGEEGEGE